MSSRTKKSAINTMVGLICTILSSLISFALRGLFIRYMGLEYAGVHSLFIDILKILNIVDLGVGNAILFKLYKAIHDKNDELCEMYLKLYRNICWGIGLFVGVAGLCFVPFLEFFVHKKPQFPEPLWSLYIIVIAISMMGHFVGFSNILFTAHQDRFIVIIIRQASIFLTRGLQLVSLIVYKNIYIYLLISLVTVMLRGLVMYVFSQKRYHQGFHKGRRITREEFKELTKDLGALGVFKLCRQANTVLDTFLISKFVSISVTGIYGSIHMIMSEIGNLLSTVDDGIIASVGDLNASGDKKRLEEVLDMTMHLVYLLRGISVCVLVPLLKPIMIWWIGHSLDTPCLWLLFLIFYIAGQNATMATFRNAMGLYRKGWKRPIGTLLVNFISSIILIQYYGIMGAFIGTILSQLVSIFYDPYIIYHYGLNRSMRRYYERYILYILLIAVSAVATGWLGTMLPEAKTFISLAWHGCIYLICGSMMIMVLGMLFPEQKALFKMFWARLLKKKKRLKPEVAN